MPAKECRQPFRILQDRLAGWLALDCAARPEAAAFGGSKQAAGNHGIGDLEERNGLETVEEGKSEGMYPLPPCTLLRNRWGKGGRETGESVPHPRRG